MNKQIRIPLNKTKITLQLIASIMFVILGIWFVINPDRFITIIIKNPDIIRVIGVISGVFFGICSVLIFRKLFDKKNGLTIDENGITDNSNATSIGLVEWNDIRGIREITEFSQKFIMIDVSNPEFYINNKNSGVGKIAMKANYKKYGSPISITSNSLKSSFERLKFLIEENKLNQVQQP